MEKEEFKKVCRAGLERTIHLYNNAVIFADEYSFLDGDRVRFRSNGETTGECDLRDIKEVS